MTKKDELNQLKGIGKILDKLWENSYYSMGLLGSQRIKEEMIYFFGKNWTTDMYKFIGGGSLRPEMPRILKELTKLK